MSDAAPGARKRSGTPTTPNTARRRPMVTLTLSPESIEKLDAIAEARGETRSGAVEEMIRRTRLARALAKGEKT